MAVWNKLNIDPVGISNITQNTTNKSLFIGNRTINGIEVPVAAIYAGSDPSVIDDPVANCNSIYFHTSNSYLKIKNIVSVTLTIPSRNVRSTSGGKKSGGGNISYNGYADYYIYKHSYGDPPPAFAVYITNDASNGTLAGHGLTGSIPLQFNNADSFRIGLCYSTSEYICVRERYQVYSSTLVELVLKVHIYFFDNPISVNAKNTLRIVHTPTTLDAYETSSNDIRSISQVVTFNAPISGQQFDKVIIKRVNGVASAHSIYQLDGANLATPIDPESEYTYTLPSLTNQFTMGIRSSVDTPGYRTFDLVYKLIFVNSVTNTSVIDYVGGIHVFDDVLANTGLPGLAGKIFTGTWRPTISTGNIGTLPLSSPTRYTNISYSNLGDNYGFIAIGYFKPPVEGTYTFYTASDDGSGVWVGDTALVGSTRTATNAVVNNNLGGSQGVTKRSGTKYMYPNRWYAIRLVHEEGGSADGLTFSWSGPNIAETTDLSSHFRTPINTSTSALLGTYLSSGMPLPYTVNLVSATGINNATTFRTISADNKTIYMRCYGAAVNDSTRTQTIVLSTAYQSTISYSIKTSSEVNYDFGYLIINGSTIQKLSGTTNVTSTLSVPAGNITIEVRYTKDVSVSVGTDDVIVNLTLGQT